MSKLLSKVPFDIIKTPHVTEKSTLQSSHGKVTFLVDKNATKSEIKRAVEFGFDVKVVAVNTIVCKGKKKAFKGRPYVRSTTKKAIISLQEGSTIELGSGN